MAGLDFLAGLGVLLAAVFMRESNSLAVISMLLLFESDLGAFETPTVQSCIPFMQTGETLVRANAVVMQITAVQSCIPFMQKGENLIRANAVVIQINALSAFFSPILGSLVYTAFGSESRCCTPESSAFFFTACFECFDRESPVRSMRNKAESKSAAAGERRFSGQPPPHNQGAAGHSENASVVISVVTCSCSRG